MVLIENSVFNESLPLKHIAYKILNIFTIYSHVNSVILKSILADSTFYWEKLFENSPRQRIPRDFGFSRKVLSMPTRTRYAWIGEQKLPACSMSTMSNSCTHWLSSQHFVLKPAMTNLTSRWVIKQCDLMLFTLSVVDDFHSFH